jgi:hypothetical protein
MFFPLYALPWIPSSKKLPCSFGTARQLYNNRFRRMQELQLHVEVALQQALEAAAMASLVLGLQ